MEFNKSYDRQEFVHFLKNSFLPEDFVQMEENVEFRTKTQYSTHAVKLGSSETLDLVVFEIRHNSRNDARVSLSKEAFRLLADEMEDRALVVFVPEDNNTLYRFSFIEITLNIDEDSSRVTRTYSNPRRYSYLLGEGISYYTPNKYLNEKGRVVNDEDLHERFSVEVLTNDFYEELSDWFAWAITQIKFPNDIEDKNDDEKYNNECAIRLITRLMFVWFLKQRHLIPEEFFDEKFIAEHLLKDFAPNKTEGFYKQKSLESKYYKAILQNLFFAMLNRPICEEGSSNLDGRRFRKSDGDFNINYLMRYEKYFKNTQLFIDLANKTVPFLNGGLFDCLDDKDKGEYYDCFTDRKAINQYLCFPDYLFFGDEAGKNIDLSEFYGDKKKKKVSARGIIDILKRYNFTVEENTPFDKEVSLDPELLGKAFENLLAAYNPETQSTARKQTGSFYTPREIVQYMVDESLVAHLKRTVGDELEAEYRKLLHYTDEPFNLNEQQRHAIMQSLFNCKILDPACGSGAFPMGILQQMVHILQRIDPDNSRWKEMMLNQAVGETKAAFMNDIYDERHELLNDIERNFDERINRPDYARKLYLIENCIYGVDIQPIAIQISKLRFFISLVVDQKTNDDPTDNFGIRPLPNLEAKFVAANTLIGLAKKETTLFDTDAIKEREQALKLAKHKIFSAKTLRTKRKYRQQVNDLRVEIANMLEEAGAVGNIEAQALASWDMFDQNISSPFFDPQWMFDVRDGFDIVIANPPYGYIFKDKPYLPQITKKYSVAEYKVDAYSVFTECGYNLISSKGILCFIMPYTFISGVYFSKFRRYLQKVGLNKLVILGRKVFEAVEVDTTIIMMEKGHKNNKVTVADLRDRKVLNLTSFSSYNISRNKFFALTDEVLLIAKEEETNLYLKLVGKAQCKLSSVVAFYHGIQTRGNKKALTYTKFGDKFLPIIKGANFKRYHVDYDGLYINFIPSNVKSGGDLSYYQVPRKLVLRTTADKIVAAIDTNQYLALNSVNVAVPIKASVDIFYILGVINSKLIDFWYTLTVQEKNKTFAEVKIVYLERIPIVDLPAMSQFPIIKKVHELISCRDSIRAAQLEQAIDLMVYKLYGLNYEEVKVVDPETTIKEEEYAKGE